MMKISQSAFRPFSFGSLLVFLVVLAPAGPALMAQALPAAEAAPISTGFAFPSNLGSLQYAVSASQSLTWGFYGNSGAAAATNVTGDIAYLSNSKADPFSLVFSGGHAFSETSYEPSYSFLNLAFSQVITAGRWNIVLSDSVNYLPGTPVTGLSGVAGVGDVGVNPVQVGSDTGQGILTNYSSRVSNVASGSVARHLTGKTSLTASGSYSTTQFLGGSSSESQGLNSDAATGAGGVTHQVNARNTFGGNYSYMTFNYPQNNLGLPAVNFVSQVASGFFSHQFTRKFGMTAAAGPEWTKVGNSGSGTGLSLFVDTTATYAAKTSTLSAAFLRSTAGGNGVVGGALSDSATLSASHRFWMVWNVSVTSGYTQSSNLPVANAPAYTVNTVVSSLQVSRAILRSLSGYASYTFEDQHYSGSAIDIYSGDTQVVGFGVTYSPPAAHLGHQ